MKRSKKALKNIVVSLLLQVTIVICGFIVPKAIIRSFGSSVNGLISSITQFLAYITLLESGIGSVIKSTLYKPIAEKDNNQIANILGASERFFRTISYIFLGYILVLCFVLPIIMSGKFDTLFTISLVLIISISTFAEYYFGMTYRLYLQAEQKTYITSGIQIVTTILNAILTILLIKFGANIQIVKLISATIFVLRPIAQNIYVKKKYNIKLNEADKEYKLEQKWDGLAQHIAYVVHSNTDIMLLTLLTDISEVSVYSIYYLVASGVRNLIQAFTGGIDASFGDMMAKNEKETLNKSFRLYEFLYFSIVTIVYVATLLLIVPFVGIYTKGITDANYYRPVFGWLLVLSEFMWTIRLPYNSLTLAAGHFKQTMKGAWVEAGTNIVLSIILVFKFGIVGVAIGTLVAMIIRTVEFMYHTSKYILERDICYAFERLGIVALEVIMIVLISNIIPSVSITSYLTWAMQGVITVLIATVVVGVMNSVFYKDEMKSAVGMGKNLIWKK